MNQKSIKTALLLIDIQNDYFENGKMQLVGSEMASDKAKLMLDRFRVHKRPVIHIQHIAVKPTATFFLPGSKGAEIHENVKPAFGEKLIVKHYPNSFRETGLLEYLNELEITDLVVCGMMTHMCVDASVRAAKDLGFNITLIGDACATKDLKITGRTAKAEDVQTSFLAALNQTYATIELAGNYRLEEKVYGSI